MDKEELIKTLQNMPGDKILIHHIQESPSGYQESYVGEIIAVEDQLTGTIVIVSHNIR
jgi:hypothetical protein